MRFFRSLDNFTSRLTERGKIKIGGKGDKKTSRNGAVFYQPVSHEYFVITTMERDNETRLIPDKEIMAQLDKEPTTLKVQLLFDELELNFPHNLSAYDKSALVCQGNQQKAFRKNGNEWRERECVCEWLKEKKCKPYAMLTCQLRDMSVPSHGVYIFRTHSWFSIQNIASELTRLASLTGGIIAGLPLIFQVYKRTFTPKDTNFSATKEIVTIGFDGTFDELIESADRIRKSREAAKGRFEVEQEKLVAEMQKNLDEGIYEDDPAEVVAEYYPEQQPGYTPNEISGGIEYPRPVDPRNPGKNYPGKVVLYKQNQFVLNNDFEWELSEAYEMDAEPFAGDAPENKDVKPVVHTPASAADMDWFKGTPEEEQDYMDSQPLPEPPSVDFDF